jgi:histidinol-phosphate aminotransferase
MGFELEKLVRPHLLNMQPYSSARDEYSGSEGIFLDANENAFGSPTEENYHRYPDPYQWELKANIGSQKNLKKEQIFLGNGSDEAIDLLIRLFCEPGKDKVIIMPPTYGMYEVSANVNNVEVLKVPLTEEFHLNVEEVESLFSEQTKLLFICNPNNPTGNSFSDKRIKQLIEKFPGVVVVDEAYIDFSPNKSYLEVLGAYPNLVVLQTFSKAWGFAALRCGLAFSSESIINLLNKIKPPYNVNLLTQQIVNTAILEPEKKKRMVKAILDEREVLRKALLELDIVNKVFPSDANFLLVKINEARKAYEYLVSKNVIVRDRSKVALCESSLRITVGTGTENKILINKLKEFAKTLESAEE